MPRTPIRLTYRSMYTGMLLAFELYKARRDDLLRQAEKYRLGRDSRRAARAPVLETLPREGYLNRA